MQSLLCDDQACSVVIHAGCASAVEFTLVHDGQSKMMLACLQGGLHL